MKSWSLTDSPALINYFYTNFSLDFLYYYDSLTEEHFPHFTFSEV